MMEPGESTEIFTVSSTYKLGDIDRHGKGIRCDVGRDGKTCLSCIKLGQCRSDEIRWKHTLRSNFALMNSGNCTPVPLSSGKHYNEADPRGSPRYRVERYTRMASLSVQQLFALEGQTEVVSGSTKGVGQAEAGADIVLIRVCRQSGIDSYS